MGNLCGKPAASTDGPFSDVVVSSPREDLPVSDKPAPAAPKPIGLQDLEIAADSSKIKAVHIEANEQAAGSSEESAVAAMPPKTPKP